MMDFLHIAFALPTAAWSVLLILVGLYWLLVIAGALDIDLIHVDFDADGAMDGALHAGVEGGLDGLDGAAHGHLEGAADAASAKAGALSGLSAVAKLLQVLGLRRVPLTVAGSFIIFFGWIASFCGMAYAAPLLVPSLGAPMVRSLVSLGSLLVGFSLGSISARPLGPVFAEQPARRRAELLGSVCRLSTLRVDGRFGQAELATVGSDLVLPVRCDLENTLTKGDEALIIHYDPAREAYVIEPLQPGRDGAAITARVAQAKSQDTDRGRR